MNQKIIWEGKFKNTIGDYEYHCRVSLSFNDLMNHNMPLVEEKIDSNYPWRTVGPHTAIYSIAIACALETLSTNQGKQTT